MYSPLSVCLLAGLLKNLWTDLDKILWEGNPPPIYHSMTFGGDPDS